MKKLKPREPFEDPKPEARFREPGLARPKGLTLVPARSEIDGKITADDIQRWGALLHPDEMRFLRLLAKGYDPEDCAALVGRPPEDGEGIVAKLLAMTAGYAFFRMQISHRVSGLTGPAINRLQKIIEEGADREALQAVRMVLDATAWFGTRADAQMAAARSAGVENAVATAEELDAQARQLRDEIARLDELAERVRAGLIVEGEAEEVKGPDDAGPPDDPAPWD